MKLLDFYSSIGMLEIACANFSHFIIFSGTITGINLSLVMTSVVRRLLLLLLRFSVELIDTVSTRPWLTLGAGGADLYRLFGIH